MLEVLKWQYLNTSHVKVQMMNNLLVYKMLLNLNTSHVKVQTKEISNGVVTK